MHVWKMQVSRWFIWIKHTKQKYSHVICIHRPLGAFNFSIFKAPLKALHSGAKLLVKSLLKAPPSRGLTITKNNKWPESFKLTFLAYPIVIPHKLCLHWSSAFREEFEHTHIHRHIDTFSRKPSVLNICTCPYILVYQTQHLRVVPDKIKWGMAEFILVCLIFAN